MPALFDDQPGNRPPQPALRPRLAFFADRPSDLFELAFECRLFRIHLAHSILGVHASREEIDELVEKARKCLDLTYQAIQ